MMADQPQGEMPQGDGGGMPLDFNGWIEQQDETIKSLVTSHIGGLKTALQSERQQRTELAKALKEATKGLEEGSQARDALTQLSTKLEGHEQQLAFYEVATAAGVKNLRLAWLAAKEAGAVDQRGNVNLQSLKTDYPELFGTPQLRPSGNAGNGAGSGAPGGKSMDNFIRTVAGRS